MAKLQPKPAEAGRLYFEIERRQKRVEQMVGVCLGEGIEQRNKRIIIDLNRLVWIRAREIQEYCKQLAGLLPDVRGKGRYPKWYTVALDVNVLAQEIAEQEDEIKKALRVNEFIVTEAALNKVKRLACRMGKLLGTVPQEVQETEDLTVWQEAFKNG